MEYRNYKEDELVVYLKKHFGFHTFKNKQLEIIQSVLSGNNNFVLMPTGGGKSLCYQLPGLVLEGTAIIISPLIALMKNQVDAMRNFGLEDNVAHFFNSTLSKNEITKVKNDLVNGKTKLLFVAPESLGREKNMDFLKNIDISFYAVDEAHCISEWGHDFRTEYRKIRSFIDKIKKAPVIALTATATPKVQSDIINNLKIKDAKTFTLSFLRPNLYYEVRPKIDPMKNIIKFIKNNHDKSGIIYCLSRKKTEEIAEMLNVNGIKALPYHAGLEPTIRAGNQDKFLMEKVNVIVATIAFGMGIDKPDIRYVIHYDMPKSLEGYYQETGRAGRDGGEGQCICFYRYKDIQKLEKFSDGKPVSEQEISRHLLLELVTYSESSICRKKSLLSYFGETLKDDCENCDNCLRPKPKFEGMEYMIKALKTIDDLKVKYKLDIVAKVLAGKISGEIKANKLNKLKFFGCGSDKDNKFWSAVLRQALISQLVTKEIENYGLIFLTDEGKKYIKSPYSFMIALDHDYDAADDIRDKEEEIIISHHGSTGAVDLELFSLLKDLRKKMSQKVNLPPFIIFQDQSLEDMAIQYPITTEEMQKIVGVGVGKAKRYGEEFIKLIKLYVEEKDIERPQDLFVKQMPVKSEMKVFIIQKIDMKISLEDIAEARGLEFEELLTEVEGIINSGIKINIDYYINQIMDREKIQMIYDYFKQTELDDLNKAIDELGNEFAEEDIRLVRIKFISEMAN